MQVVVLCSEPDTAIEPDSVVAALVDLGCRVALGRFDLAGLDADELRRRSPAIVVIDAGDELGRANQCRRKLAEFPPLEDVPTLLAVTVPRLAALDFSVGFDDFVLLPIVPAELHARLRQLDWRTAAFGSEEVIKLGDLVIDVSGYEAHLRGRRLEFTHKEFELLLFLARNRGRVFTREQLLHRVWDYHFGAETRTVDIHVRRVRAKLGATGALIQTVRNVGYKLRSPDD